MTLKLYVVCSFVCLFFFTLNRNSIVPEGEDLSVDGRERIACASHSKPPRHGRSAHQTLHPWRVVEGRGGGPFLSHLKNEIGVEVKR